MGNKVNQKKKEKEKKPCAVTKAAPPPPYDEHTHLKSVAQNVDTRWQCKSIRYMKKLEATMDKRLVPKNRNINPPW